MMSLIMMLLSNTPTLVWPDTDSQPCPTLSNMLPLGLRGNWVCACVSIGVALVGAEGQGDIILYIVGTLSEPQSMKATQCTSRRPGQAEVQSEPDDTPVLFENLGNPRLAEVAKNRMSNV